MCSLFENPVTVYKDNQGVIALVVSPQMQLRTNIILIKYHHFRTFIANGDIEIKYADTKEHIVDIFLKPLYSKFLDIYATSLTVGR